MEKEEGMVPVKLLLAKVSNHMLGSRLPMYAGMLPWSMLDRNSSTCNEDMLYSESGNSPERWLKARLRTWRPRILPRLRGMVPSSWLDEMSRTLSDDKFAMDDGMVPMKLLSLSWSLS